MQQQRSVVARSLYRSSLLLERHVVWGDKKDGAGVETADLYGLRSRHFPVITDSTRPVSHTDTKSQNIKPCDLILTT